MAQGFFWGRWKCPTAECVTAAQPYERTKPPNCKLQCADGVVCESHLNETAITAPLHPPPLPVDSGSAEFPDSCHYKVCLLPFLQRVPEGHRVPLYTEASAGWSPRDGLKLPARGPPTNAILHTLSYT